MVEAPAARAPRKRGDRDDDRGERDPHRAPARRGEEDLRAERDAEDAEEQDQLRAEEGGLRREDPEVAGVEEEHQEERGAEPDEERGGGRPPEVLVGLHQARVLRWDHLAAPVLHAHEAVARAAGDGVAVEPHRPESAR